MGAKYSHWMWESFPYQQNHFSKTLCFFCGICSYWFSKPLKGRIYIRWISASGKTPSAAKHTIGCTSPDDIDTNPGLSKTMAREQSYRQNRFKTYSFHENQKVGFVLLQNQDIVLFQNQDIVLLQNQDIVSK